MFRVLAIGNSFSQDAMAYLVQLAASGGVEMEAVNLYIGGCSLARLLAGNPLGEYAKRCGGL